MILVDLGGSQKLLRIQIKGTGGDSINFTGGGRSGQQIRKDKDAPNKTYKYTEKDCDLIIGIDTNNGDCYIIPIQDIEPWGNSRSLSKLQDYKEKWSILIDIASIY